MKIVLLNGVNLNMLGKRNPEHYGQLHGRVGVGIMKLAEENRFELECFQTNHEGEMVEKIHQIYFEKVNGVIINPGAWTHYSYAIRDALEILECPIIEVHLSDIDHREDFRRKSVIRPVAQDTIMGKGVQGYKEAMRKLMKGE